MSDQENKQANQDLPSDSAEQPKPAPKPSPEKQAPPPAKIVLCGQCLACSNPRASSKDRLHQRSVEKARSC